LWDRGFWAPEGSKPLETALKDGDFKFVLAGERLRGSWVLVRIKHNRGRDTGSNWLLIKHKDEYARAGGTAALIKEDRSVASGRSLDQIARGVDKSPRPFMVSTPDGAAADAVWHSNRTDPAPTASVRAPKAQPKPQARSGKWDH
jgi:bifunctional non-homologous end joining protein LigD